MMKQMDVMHMNQPIPETSKSDWVTPTLERLSLKEALAGGTGGSDGHTAHGGPTFS